MLPVVNDLVDSHQTLSGKNKIGRRYLNHITSSGVLMLCASWELYVEELASEIADHLSKRADSPGCLPTVVQKTIVKELENEKYELKLLRLAGEGWRDIYIKNLKTKIDEFHSPKSEFIDKLYDDHLGWKDSSKSWGVEANAIDEFVKLRGAITHGGLGKKNVSYVSIKKLNEKISLICTAVDTLDNAANDYIFKTLRLEKKPKRPWRRHLKS